MSSVRPQPDEVARRASRRRLERSLPARRDPRRGGRTGPRPRASELGADDGARLLTTADWTTSADWLDALFVPLVVGGSLVIVRNADEDVVERRMSQERASVTAQMSAIASAIESSTRPGRNGNRST